MTEKAERRSFVIRHIPVFMMKKRNALAGNLLCGFRLRFHKGSLCKFGFVINNIKPVNFRCCLRTAFSRTERPYQCAVKNRCRKYVQHKHKRHDDGDYGSKDYRMLLFAHHFFHSNLLLLFTQQIIADGQENNNASFLNTQSFCATIIFWSKINSRKLFFCDCVSIYI